MRRLATRTALAASALLLLTACGGGSDAADAGDKTGGASAAKPGAVVDMDFTLFAKEDYAIKAGEALTFKNNNDITHVIVGGTYEVDGTGARTSEKDDGTFKIDVSKKGDSGSQVYDKAGTYTFFCTIHKNMNGKVTVS